MNRIKTYKLFLESNSYLKSIVNDIIQPIVDDLDDDIQYEVISMYKNTKFVVKFYNRFSDIPLKYREIIENYVNDKRSLYRDVYKIDVDVEFYDSDLYGSDAFDYIEVVFLLKD